MKKILGLMMGLMIVLVSLSGCGLLDVLGEGMDEDIDDWNDKELEKILSEMNEAEIDDWLDHELGDILTDMDIEKWNNDELEKILKEAEERQEQDIDLQELEEENLDSQDNNPDDVIDESEKDSSTGGNISGNDAEGESASDESGRIKFDELHDLIASYEGLTVDSETGSNVIGYVLTIANGEIEWKSYLDGIHVFTSEEGLPLLNRELFYTYPGEYESFNNEDVYMIDFSVDDMIMQIWYSVDYLIPVKFHSQSSDEEGSSVVDYELTDLIIK